MKLPLHDRYLNLRNRWRMLRYELNKFGVEPWQRATVFDVGANDGSTFEPLIHGPRWIHVYAFEPTPELVRQMQSRYGRHSNFHLIPKAVGECTGTATFNVAGQADWGCSSLLEFSEGLERTWPGRDDFVVTQRIEVEVIRLDDFVRTNGISSIDYLHIDTQGTDLSVLRSLGDEISRVRSGVVEVPADREVMLYKNQHCREEMLDFLAGHGFEVWKTESQQNEENLFFRRATAS